jgi:hypothetical protein
VTAAYAAKRRVRTGVIIRATGTAWPLRVQGFPPRVGKKGPAEVLVLDFQDRFDTVAGKDAEHRIQEYRRQGMSVAVLGPGGA